MTLFCRPVLFAFLLVGCVGSAPAKAPQSTLPEHEAAAREAEVAAKNQEKRVDPGTEALPYCNGAPVPAVPPGSPPVNASNAPPVLGINWAGNTANCSPSNLQNQRLHRTEAKFKRQVALEHRQAAQALREAEILACYNVPADDRAVDPLSARGDILAARELPNYSRTGKASGMRRGIEVELKKAPGLSTRGLQQALNCQIAHINAYGAGGSKNSPLAVSGAAAVVTETDESFLVEITAPDKETAQEIARRAKALVPNP